MRHKRTEKGNILVRIAVILVLVVGVIIAATFFMFSHYKGKYITGENAAENFQKGFGKAWDAISEGQFKEKTAPNEKEMITCLKAYVVAQKKYNRENGRYTQRLSNLDIPKEMIAARIENIHGENYKDGFYGYHFIHVKMNGTTKMNYNKDFVLCAIPVLYRVTGINTFAVGPKGIVLKKDNVGMPVHNAVEFSKGWECCE